MIDTLETPAPKKSQPADNDYKVTEFDLYAIAMESEHACKILPALCKLAGVPYPPNPHH